MQILQVLRQHRLVLKPACQMRLTLRLEHLFWRTAHGRKLPHQLQLQLLLRCWMVSLYSPALGDACETF